MTRGPLGRRALRTIGVVAMVAWVVVPFYFIVLVAVQTKASALRRPTDWWPDVTWSNFRAVIDRLSTNGPASQPTDLVLPGMGLSLRVAVAVAAVVVTLGAGAGYAFARFRFPGSRTLPNVMLATQLVPVLAYVVPYYVVLRRVGLTNVWGVILANVAATLPFAIFILRSMFDAIPRDIERAAQLDGARPLFVFVRLMVPLARSGLLAVGLFAFIIAWNDVFFSLLLNTRGGVMLQPAIAGLTSLLGQSVGLVAAATLVSAAPMMLVAVLAQRYLVSGLSSGTGKA